MIHQNQRIIGLITIGQSPRPDIIKPIAEAIGYNFTLLESGALDGINEQRISDLQAGGARKPLATVLNNGQAVILNATAIVPLINQQVDSLTEQGADFTLLLCTHEFPSEQLSHKLTQPCKLMQSKVEQALPKGNLSVVCPHAGQVESTHTQFARANVRVSVSNFNPHEGLRVKQLAEQLTLQQPDLIYLDCFSFSVDFAANLGERLGVPVYCPSGLTAQLIMNEIKLP